MLVPGYQSNIAFIISIRWYKYNMDFCLDWVCSKIGRYGVKLYVQLFFWLSLLIGFCSCLWNYILFIYLKRFCVLLFVIILPLQDKSRAALEPSKTNWSLHLKLKVISMWISLCTSFHTIYRFWYVVMRQRSVWLKHPSILYV